jgi:hypothetical protein
LLAPLPVIVALGAWGSARAAEEVGNVLGGVLANFAALLTKAEAKGDDETFEFQGTGPAPTIPAAAPVQPKAGKGQRAKANKGSKALFVSAQTVLRIASARVNLRGSPVRQEGARPPGLKLGGVSALGVGLSDGDVLTRALGQPALSRDAVVRAVLLARARRDKVLEGEFYRGSERWVLRVEQPYLPEPKADVTAPGHAEGVERLARR